MEHKVNQQGQHHLTSTDGIIVQKYRSDITLTLKAGNKITVGPTWSGGYFEPRKIVVTWWPEEGRMKARVSVSGVPNRGNFQSGGNTCTFNLSGYDNYNPCPEWLARLVREFGYQHPIERIV